MIRHGLLLAGVVCLGIVTACGDDDAATSAPADSTSMPVPDTARTGDEGSAPDLDGREFVSTEVERYELVEGSEIRIAFQDGSLSANAGCNTMGGGYRFEGATLQVEAMAMTEMACEEPLMAQDAFIIELLTGGPTVEVDGDVLTITSDAATLTMLDREVAEPDVPLQGVTWQLESIVTGDAVSPVPAGIESTLEFGDDGNAAVNTGCNSASGGVDVGDGTLTFGMLATTLMLCEGPAGEVETAVTTTLTGEVAYTIDGDVLSIRAEDGSGLDYRAAE